MIRCIWCACVALFAACVIACSGAGESKPSSPKADASVPAVAPSRPGAGKPSVEKGSQPTPAVQSEPPKDAAADVRTRYAERTVEARKERASTLRGARDRLDADLGAAVKTRDKEKKQYELDRVQFKVTPKKKEEYEKKAAERETEITSLKQKIAISQRDLDGVAKWVPRTSPHNLKADEVTRFGADEGYTPVFVIFQRIDGGNVLVKWDDEIFWVEGISILSADEKKTTTFEGIIEATGTKEYTNPLGGRRAVRSFREHPDTKR